MLDLLCLLRFMRWVIIDKKPEIINITLSTTILLYDESIELINEFLI